MTRRATAAVLRQRGQGMSLEEVEVEPPRPDEVVVRLASVGICRSDLHARNYMPLPIVLGHEGAGRVEAVGGAVTRVAVGDPVVMTFHSCGGCRRCLTGDVAYCQHFNELNFTGRRPDGSTPLTAGGEPIGSHFLGQSSFASLASVNERSVVRLPQGAKLEPLGPFGCGFQTGAGAVFNVLRPGAGSSLAVFGAGAVGLAAVAAAAMVGCHPVVAVDIYGERLELARRLGATHTVDAGKSDPAGVIASLLPDGIDFAIETTGANSVARTAVSALNTRGVCGLIGAGASDELTVDWRTLLNGRTVTGIIAGGSVPEVFLSHLIELYWAGRFPIDAALQYFPFADIERAVAASEGGEAVKAVLLF